MTFRLRPYIVKELFNSNNDDAYVHVTCPNIINCLSIFNLGYKRNKRNSLENTVITTVIAIYNIYINCYIFLGDHSD